MLSYFLNHKADRELLYNQRKETDSKARQVQSFLFLLNYFIKDEQLSIILIRVENELTSFDIFVVVVELSL